VLAMRGVKKRGKGNEEGRGGIGGMREGKGRVGPKGWVHGVPRGLIRPCF
jgi:hypothetical protein